MVPAPPYPLSINTHYIDLHMFMQLATEPFINFPAQLKKYSQLQSFIFLALKLY